MKVLILGGTGFTGLRVVSALAERGHLIRCLVRKTSNQSGLADVGVEQVTGDASDPESILSAVKGMDAAVTLISLGSGFLPGLVNCFEKSSISRCLFFGTTSIFQTLDGRDRKMRLDAEGAIRSSGLAWTILRPTMIYGAPGDRNVARLIQYLMKRSWIPVFGSGEYLLQPVFVQDLAVAVTQILENDSTAGKDYNLPGGQVLTFNEMVDLIGHRLGRRISKIHLPVLPVVWGLRFLQYVQFPVPLKAEQVLRFNEDKTFSLQPAEDDFGYQPRSFDRGVREEIEILSQMQMSASTSNSQ